MTKEFKMLLGLCRMFLYTAVIVAMLAMAVYFCRNHEPCMRLLDKAKQENMRLEQKISHIRERDSN